MRLSYSKIKDYQRCPQLFKYKHIDGLKDDSDKSADLHFGSALHLGLEMMLTRGADAKTTFDTYWNSLKDLEYGRLTHKQLSELGHVFLNRFESGHLKKIEVIGCEVERLGVIGGREFKGIVDLTCKLGGKKTIMDFKTAGYAYEKEKIICDEQMYIYDHLLADGYEQVCYKVFVKNYREPRIQTIVAPLSALKTQNMVYNIDLWAVEIDKGPFTYPRNSQSCFMGSKKCFFFDKCFGAKND